MRVILAEKPSVAQSIAAVLGADQKKNGYLQGENDIVSWCIGHLIELAPPEIYDARYAKWRREDLPIVPSAWESVVSDGTKKQFAVLKDLLNRTDVDEVVCATDAGREGELIFRMAYEKTGCTKPVKRLWISSLEESAIREGFRSLKPGTAYDALYRAALCRAQADWLVGINGTRLYSRLYGTKLNVGRVMTPTLAMVVQREKEIAAFQVEQFYTVQLSCGFPAQSGRIKTREEAERIRASCHCKKAAVKQIERRQKKEKPPKLYDLTALQRDANRIYGYTAQQTLDYAQTLYEKKLATYPRTDSRFLTHDLRDRLPALIECVAQVLPFASGLLLAVHTQQVIRDEKVSDHHAIIPTQNMTREALAQLPMGERSILTLLAVRLLAATGEPCETDEVTVTLDCEGHDFTAKGSTVRQMGYRMFEETFRGSLGSRERKEQEYPIPPLEIGQTVGPVVATIREGQTTPPKRYTEDTLLAAMETAGAKDAPEDAERKGLGTPATRAGTLEKLVDVGFVVRKGEQKAKSLYPTEKAAALIAVLPENLRSPMMTAQWEQRLKRIEHGQEEAAGFMDDIVRMVTELVQSAQPVPDAQKLFPSDRPSVGTCPCCGAVVTETAKGFFCESRICRFGIWKDNRFFAQIGQSVNKGVVEALIRDGAAKLKGLRSKKTGRRYDATLKMMCGEQGVPRFQLEFEREEEK